ncbi:putative Ig domain-containing protein [candidate division KSB1 bacterium]
MHKTVLKILLLLLLTSVLFTDCSDNITGPVQDTDLRFTSIPIENIFHNYTYDYTVTAAGGYSGLTIRAVTLPLWLEFDEQSNTITGTPTADNLGYHSIKISVSDSLETVYQEYVLKVNLRQVPGGSWVGHFPHNWSHDGHPFIGVNCDVYSDASSDEVKQIILEKAEYAYSDLLQLLDISDPAIFIFPDGRTKIDIYANRFNTEYYGGFAYHGGAIVLSPDHPNYQPNAGWCVNEVEHEMMHVIETLIEGSGHLMCDVWLREGIADHYAGNTLITTVQEMNVWLASRLSMAGGGNPVKIHLWSDFPSEVEVSNTQGLWYPMFELATRYLLDDNGLGNTYMDIKNIFWDTSRNNISFSEAFETHMGISLQYYEDNFFNIISEYLNNTNLK